MCGRGDLGRLALVVRPWHGSGQYFLISAIATPSLCLVVLHTNTDRCPCLEFTCQGGEWRGVRSCFESWFKFASMRGCLCFTSTARERSVDSIQVSTLVNVWRF